MGRTIDRNLRRSKKREDPGESNKGKWRDGSTLDQTSSPYTLTLSCVCVTGGGGVCVLCAKRSTICLAQAPWGGGVLLVGNRVFRVECIV